MAIETSVIIELKGLPVIIPESVYVKLGSIVRFIVRVNPHFFHFLELQTFQIELYFSYLPPVGFDKNYKTTIDARDILNQPLDKEFVVAQGVVGSRGEFKYGVKAATKDGEELFDEDPYLIVYV